MKLSENIINDQGSKYSVCGAPVTTKKRCFTRPKRTEKNKKYAKATHNTWAVLLTDIGPLKNDDGEIGSGMVIVRMLEREQLFDHLIIVTRWFGGPQLGSDIFRRVKDCVHYYFNQRT